MMILFRKKLPHTKRVKTPVVLQMEAVECGAASLGMVLGYYGCHIPLEELRYECGVSRDGSKANNIVKAARKYGLEAKGFRKEPEALYEMTFPLILFWNFNHFIVLEGFRNGKAYINDPAGGPRQVSLEEFDESFTGVVLTFSPGPEFKKCSTKTGMFQSLKKRLSGSESAVVYIFIAALLLVIPGLIIPTFSKIFVDDILISKMIDWFKPLIVVMGITLIIRGLLTWLQQYYLLRTEMKIALSSSASFFYHVFRLPIEFFSQRFPGEIGGRVLLNDKVAQLLSKDLATNVLNFLLIIFYAVLMFRYDFILSLVCMISAGINIAVLRIVAKQRVVLNQKLQQETGKLLGLSMSGLRMVETLKATGSESDFFSHWSGQQAKVVNVQQQLALPSQILSAVPVFLMLINNGAILCIGGFRVMDGHLSMGMLMAFQALLNSFMLPVNDMVNLGSKLQEMQADMNRLDDVQNYKKDDRFTQTILSHSETERMKRLDGSVEIKNVTFGYNRLEIPLIKDFSLSMTPGMRIALVGASGSGKSTIAKLVSGLYRPWDGEIYLDGTRLIDIPRDVMTSSVSMVDQDIFMFKGTVKENLTMWDSTISENDMIQAAKDACIHDDIALRQGGYSSIIDEGGGNFSGGQCQRLEIARALVTNPRILILDEATSALDPNTEKQVELSLKRRGCTCIIVAHRLSTIRDCDEIIVLERGVVVQRGTHDQMIAIDGPYASLIKAR